MEIKQKYLKIIELTHVVRQKLEMGVSRNERNH